MDDFGWLTAAGVLPLVGAVVIGLLPAGLRRYTRHVALVASLLTLVLVVAMALQFDVGAAGTDQFVEQYAWIPQFGVSYALGVDGIGLVMVALAAVLVPVCVLASWHDAVTPGSADTAAADGEAHVSRRADGTFFALVLVLETMMIGVFAAQDVFLFYVFFEAMLIPVYFLIGRFGGAKRQYAAVKFLLFSLAGGLVMLAAVIGLYVAGPGGETGFLISELQGAAAGNVVVERALFLGFFFAFAVKAPMWPVHTWLPDAAAEAPSGVAVLLVGVLDKVGTFGMITLCLPLFPEASRWAAPVIVVFAVISILYGALVAIGQTDLKRLIAYTSVSHFGFIVMGIFAMTTVSQSGAVLYMVNHGFSTAALFLVGGMFIARRGSARIADYGGMQRVTPLLAGSFLIAGLSSLALPGMSSFVSEFLVILGTFSRYEWAAVFAVLGVVLAALYILLTYQRMMTGPVREHLSHLPDMRTREAWVMAPLLAIILVLGFYPRPVLDVLDPAIERTMTSVGVTDPAPTGGSIPVADVSEGADQ